MYSQFLGSAIYRFVSLLVSVLILVGCSSRGFEPRPAIPREIGEPIILSKDCGHITGDFLVDGKKLIIKNSSLVSDAIATSNFEILLLFSQVSLSRQVTKTQEGKIWIDRLRFSIGVEGNTVMATFPSFDASQEMVFEHNFGSCEGGVLALTPHYLFAGTEGATKNEKVLLELWLTEGGDLVIYKQKGKWKAPIWVRGSSIVEHYFYVLRSSGSE